MQIQPTTALSKIARLTKRIRAIPGGQGAGKTFSILWLIADHAYKNPNTEIVVASGELAKMKPTVIKDFFKIMKSTGIWDAGNFNRSESQFNFFNGSWIRFIGLMDKPDIGKGFRTNILFVNEANKISFDAYRQISSRAQIIVLDFNPDGQFWYHDEVKHLPDCEEIILTHKDNEFLSDEERNEILGYKAKGFDKNGNVINEYWANKYRVYTLGELGGVEGRIFHWKKCSYKEFVEIDKPVFYGVDWGTQDPFAVVAVKYHDGKLFVDEINYDSENKWRRKFSEQQLSAMREKEEGLVTYLWKKFGIPYDAKSICDRSRDEKIRAIRKAGWLYTVKSQHQYPGAVNERVEFLQNLDIYYTDRSKNIEMENFNYQWDKDRYGISTGKPKDADNHTIDAIGMVVMYLASQRVIRVV